MKHIALSLVLLFAACGEDVHSHPDAGMPDAGELPTATAFAVGTDYLSPGIASTISIPELAVAQGAIDGVASSDPVVRYQNGQIFVVNRYGADNITTIDAATLTLAHQISTGNGSNPQDVVAYGGMLYVAALGATGVLVLDPANPNAGVVRTIDLSALDSVDGLPNCQSLAISGNMLYVSCEILDDNDPWLAPRGPGQVAVIALANESVVATLKLTTKNPYGFVLATDPNGAYGGDVLVPTVPDWGALSAGCIERITVGQTPSPAGCFIKNADLGGIVSSIAEDDQGRLWIVVTEGWDQNYAPVSKVLSYDPGTSMLSSTSLTPTEQKPIGIAFCPTGDLAILESGAGVRIYGAGGSEKTTAVLDIGMPPSGVVCY